MATEFHSVIPILRIFDVEKSREFYEDFLGFSKDWDHRFGSNFPLYRQISRGNLIIHLSEHHGDSSPGVHIRVKISGITSFQEELHSKQYRYMKPGITTGVSADQREMEVIDPFGNRITFVETQSEEKEKESQTTEGVL